MFNHIGRMADNAMDQDLIFGQIRVTPDLPFMFVTRVCPLDDIGARIDPQDKIDDIL